MTPDITAELSGYTEEYKAQVHAGFEYAINMSHNQIIIAALCGIMKGQQAMGHIDPIHHSVCLALQFNTGE